MILSRYTELNADQKILVKHLKLDLPSQPPPRIASREREMVERWRALIVQIDEEINRMERELAHVSSSWFVGLP